MTRFVFQGIGEGARRPAPCRPPGMCGNRRHVMTAANTQRRNDGTTCCRACRQATDKRYRQKQDEEVAA